MNPVTEEVICHVQEGDKADVDKAVEAATKVKLKKKFSFFLQNSNIIYEKTKTFIILNINHIIGFSSWVSMAYNGCIRAWQAVEQISRFD